MRLTIGGWLVPLCGLTTVALVYLIFRNPREEEARSVFRAFVNNDPDYLYSCGSPEEWATSGLSRDEFRSLYSELVLPRAQSVKLAGAPEIASSGPNDAKTMIAQPVECTNGRVITLLFDDWHTSEGPRLAVLLNVLRNAWWIDRTTNMPKDVNLENHFKTLAYGYEKDKAKLARLGVTGIYVNPDEGFRTFAELETRWRDRFGKEYGTGY